MCHYDLEGFWYCFAHSVSLVPSSHTSWQASGESVIDPLSPLPEILDYQMVLCQGLGKHLSSMTTAASSCVPPRLCVHQERSVHHNRLNFRAAVHGLIW